jgi:purine-binding chemotaxis protein CheW
MQARAQSRPLSQYLTFRVAGETYAIDILRVREIIEHRPVTRVPMAPSCVRGVINLRGSVVPVVDLALRFGMPETIVNRRTCIVIVEAGSDEAEWVLGITADSVCQVIDLEPDAIARPPAFGTPLPAEYLRGLARTDDRFVLILDVDRALDLDGLRRTVEEPAAARTPE